MKIINNNSYSIISKKFSQIKEIKSELNNEFNKKRNLDISSVKKSINAILSSVETIEDYITKSPQGPNQVIDPK